MNNHIIVTTSWDDGHILDLKLASLLAKYGIKGTFYISPHNMEFNQTDLLSDRRIFEISKDFEIGAHTVHHIDLTTIPLSQAEKEINESKRYLESLISKTIVSFCYPRGHYNDNIKEIVKQSGYTSARTTTRFKTAIGNDHYAIPTTIHLYDHIQDVINIPLFVSNISIRWDDLAIHVFNDILHNGGMFHLWGHSWEIEKHNDWNRLENILRYLANRKNVVYVTNAELI